MRVEQRLALLREHRLAAEHVALRPVLRGVVVDGERAEHGDRIGLAMRDVRSLADEVGRLDLARGHAGLDDVVVRVELERRRRGSTSRGGRSCRRRRCPRARRRAARPASQTRSQQLRALLDRHVELPAELADVRDARGEHAQRVDLDRAAAGERERLVRHVVARHAREDVARARPPEAERRVRRGEVGDLRAAVGGQVVGVPLQVGHAVRAARDDAELLVAEPHHRQVALERAARREHRRVDDLAVRDVHLAHRDLLHASRARPAR